MKLGVDTMQSITGGEYACWRPILGARGFWFSLGSLLPALVLGTS